MYKHVKTIIDEWDPISLFPDAPDEEYEIEIREIVRRCKGFKRNDEIARIIQQVFEKYFGNTFHRSFEECLTIAKKINNSL